MITLNEDWLTSSGKYRCPECNKEYSKKGICTHIWRSHTEKGKDHTPDGNIGFKNGTRQAWNKGKTKDTDFRIAMDSVQKQIDYENGNLKIPCEKGGKIPADVIDKSWKGRCGGIRHGAGRGKHGRYNGIRCDSTWELAWVIYQLDHNVDFERNNDGFDYFFQGTKHKYYPDFILQGNDYIEIKAYETDKVKAKHSQFPYKLSVLYEDDIEKYISYVKSTYQVDDLTVLYD